MSDKKQLGGLIKRALLAICIALAIAGAAIACLYGQQGFWLYQSISGFKSFQNCRFDEAEKHAVSAVDTARRLKNNTDQLSMSLNLLAEIYMVQGKHEQALSAIQESLKSAEDRAGKEDPSLIAPLSLLGGYYRRLGQYDQAKAAYTRGLAIARKRGITDKRIVVVLEPLAKLDSFLGRTDEADTLFQQAYQISKKEDGPESIAAANCLLGLGEVEEARAHYLQAEKLYSQSADIHEKLNGHDDPDLSMTLDHLVRLYISADNLARAEPSAWRALRLKEDGLAALKDSHYHADINLATIYMDRDLTTAAEPLIENAITLSGSRSSKTHPYYANALALKALLLCHKKQFQEADAVYDQAWKVMTASVGKKHRYLARLLVCRAQMDVLEGKTDRARKDFEEALSMADSVLPADHPERARIMRRMALFLEENGDRTKATALKKQAEAIVAHAYES
ncbi:MAG TPA: tetratricopeptide repeat protein [Chroococcales cyanobacterium]